MAELKIFHPCPTLGVDYYSIYFPDEKIIENGVCEFFIQAEVFSQNELTTISIFNEPTFAIKVDINIKTREILTLIGPARDINPNISGFKFPNEFDLSNAAKFIVNFNNWNVNSIFVNDHQLERYPISLQMDMPKQPIILIAPAFKGQLAPRDLICAIGTAIFKLELMGEGLLFNVMYENYHFEVGFTNETFYIVRNHNRLEIPTITGLVTCIIQWSTIYIGLYIGSGTHPTTKNDVITVDTPPTIPPYSLVEWLRKHSIDKEDVYGSRSEFFQIVTNSLLSIPEKVLTLGLQESFWDKTYNGKKIVARRPKMEPDIQPMIHGLLHDICLAKNLKVDREYNIAGGELDFLFTGVLINKQMLNVCVEFKHAHSDRLLHGLLNQLPAYMQAKGSDFGIYCVMYFKDENFHEPEYFSDQTELNVYLDCERLKAGLNNIRIIFIDFSHRKSPSRM